MWLVLVVIGIRILLARIGLAPLRWKLGRREALGDARGREPQDGLDSDAVRMRPIVLDVSAPLNPTVSRHDAAWVSAPAAVSSIADALEHGGSESIDTAAIRAEIVEFLDRAEARARRRPEWGSNVEREQVRHRHEALAELTRAKERFDRELERERAATSRDSRSAFAQAEAAGEQRVNEARLEAGRLLDGARSEARELVFRAQGESEHTLEWSRAKGAEILRRSERVAADRFASRARPAFVAGPGRR